MGIQSTLFSMTSTMNFPKTGAILAENPTEGCELSGLWALESVRYRAFEQ